MCLPGCLQGSNWNPVTSSSRMMVWGHPSSDPDHPFSGVNSLLVSGRVYEDSKKRPLGFHCWGTIQVYTLLVCKLVYLCRIMSYLFTVIQVYPLHQCWHTITQFGSVYFYHLHPFIITVCLDMYLYKSTSIYNHISRQLDISGKFGCWQVKSAIHPFTYTFPEKKKNNVKTVGKKT